MRNTYLVVFQRLDELLARLQHRQSGAVVLLVLKLHRRPRHVQLLQHLLHAHLLDGLVDDAEHVVLEVVQVEREQVGQRRLLVHGELDARRLHQLLPVAVADGRVLQLSHRSQ